MACVIQSITGDGSRFAPPRVFTLVFGLGGASLRTRFDDENPPIRCVVRIQGKRSITRPIELFANSSTRTCCGHVRSLSSIEDVGLYESTI